MALKLSKADLPQLLSWLQLHLPQSFKLHGELESHLEGKFPDLEFFVDRWPDPQAVTANVDCTGEQLELKSFYSNQIRGVFGITDEAVTSMLKDPSVVDWKQHPVFCGVADCLWPVIKAVADDMGKPVSWSPDLVLKATPEVFKPVPVPEGMKISPISNEFIDIVNSTWKFKREGTDAFIRQLVRLYPSVVMTTDDGQHVGHMLGQSFGSMGMLYVNPDFRRKGYAKVIVSQLAKQYFDRGKDAFVAIEEDNLPSLNLHKSLGFEIVPNMKITWISVGSKGCCKCSSQTSCV